MAGYTGAGTAAILGIGTEGLLFPIAIGEVAGGLGGLAIASTTVLATGGIALGVVAVVAVGTYYSDQTHSNNTANNFQRRYGVC